MVIIGYLFLLMVVLSLCDSTLNQKQWAHYQPNQQHLQDSNRILQQQRMQGGAQPGSIIGERVLTTPPLRYKDFVTLENPPKKAKTNYPLRVTFQCSTALTIILFVDGNEVTLNEPKLNLTHPVFADPDTIFFRKIWTCQRSPVVNKIVIPLTFPPHLIQRPNILMQKAWSLKDVKLKVAMIDQALWDYMNNTKYLLRDLYHVGFERATQRLSIPIKVLPPYERSKKASRRCLTWPLELYNTIFKKRPPQSYIDNVVTDFVKSPIAYPAGQSGVARNFMRFVNWELNRPITPKDPKFTISIVLYLLDECEGLCNLFQHIDDDNHYSTPSIFISDKGQIHVQDQLADNKSYAFQTEWRIPLQEWVRIDIRQTSFVVDITMFHGENFTESKTLHNSFHMPVIVDYMAGYYVMGGSMFTKGFQGILGSATIWRNILVTSDQISHPSPDSPIYNLGIVDFFKKSDKLMKFVEKRWNYLTSSSEITSETVQDTCIPFFISVIHPRENKVLLDMCPTESKPLPRRYRRIDRLLMAFSRKRKERFSSITNEKISEFLYKKALRLLEPHDVITKMNDVINTLENAAMLRHGPSHFLLYVIYTNGFGTKIDLEKARTHIFAGALLRERMCTKTLAYKHSHGDDDRFPQDEENSLYYYFNAALISQKDRQTHEEAMTEVNRVRLTDERQLKQQTAEDEDLFQWFKHQAGTGMFHAKRNLGQLLYWGKQGLKRNLKAAFEYYEQAAQNTEDPSALYDYGITLMKGQGTNANEDKAYGVMEQAANVGSAAAVNALGWYYIRDGKDIQKAVEYFEKANELGNIDAAYNLGHMHQLGQYPGQDRDMRKAFQLYYKAATQGHVEACVRVSMMFATGIRDYLLRNVQSAIFWSKHVAELSPAMGEILREALQSFRSRSWSKATLLYLAAAETGFEVAGYNTAFLCDEDTSKVLRENIARDCRWRYWNASANHQISSPYALNKMGDYYYYGVGEEADLQEAISYYVKAARKRDPQALFNMACILEEHGDSVDNTTLRQMSLTKEALTRREDAILELYQICSSLRYQETAMPCYMGWIRMKAIVMWKYSSFLAKLAGSIIAIVISTLLIFASSLLRHQRRTDDVVRTEQGAEEDLLNGIGRTRVLQEEVIEHEILRNGSKSALEESEDEENPVKPETQELDEIEEKSEPETGGVKQTGVEDLKVIPNGNITAQEIVSKRIETKPESGKEIPEDVDQDENVTKQNLCNGISNSTDEDCSQISEIEDSDVKCSLSVKKDN